MADQRRAPAVTHTAVRGRGRVLLLLLALPLLLTTPAGTLTAAPNAFEQKQIEAQALETFRRIINLWREEVYFELYDYGQAASRTRIDQETFAQRMVELDFVPGAAPNPRYTSTNFRYRTAVYVSARVYYKHKFNPSLSFTREQTVLLLREGGRWRIDLVQLVRAPYA